MNMRNFWRLLIVGVVAGVIIVGATAAANWWILKQAQPFIVKSSAELQKNDVGIILGTSPRLAAGFKNPFFEGRIATAAILYRLGNVKHLVVSGDNGTKDYDEPSAMRDALIAKGVPASAITLDYAGFRTLDTMARAHAVFGLQRVTVITDDFHLPRAIFLARANGLEAAGFPSGHVPFFWSKKTRVREVFSRVKACLDVYALHTQPKFLGPPVAIKIVSENAP